MSSLPKAFNEIVADIKDMRIRGAGKIARAAVQALKIIGDEVDFKNEDEFIDTLKKAAKILVNTRPSAVSLPNAIRYVLLKVLKCYREGKGLDVLRLCLDEAARAFTSWSLNAIKRIGFLGSKLIKDGDVILTHCNSTAALMIVIQAKKSGKNIRVFATETRPKYQGRITVEILDKFDIETILIIDSAVNYFIHEVNKVIVGADTILSDGSVINKIGTSQLALIANSANIPFYVAAETYKFSPESIFGKIVEVEERDPREVAPESWIKKLRNVKIRNPSFDLTPPKYITAIISEIGIYSPTYFPVVATQHLNLSYKELEPWL